MRMTEEQIAAEQAAMLDHPTRAATPLDYFKAKHYTDAETQQARFAICLDCPELLKLGHICGVCKCPMQAKTRLMDASCPLGKWGSTVTPRKG